MRILFISQLFDPEYSIKGIPLMRYLVEQGHSVQVVTTFPNYPTGKVFDGYKVSFKVDEICDGVKITRLWSHISHSKSRLSRAWSYVSFATMALVYTVFSRKPDVIYAYHPQFTISLIAMVLKFFKGVPFITDVQDLWPDALEATNMQQNKRMLSTVAYLCRFTYKHAAHIVVLSHGFKAALVMRGVPSEKITIVYNWCPEEERIAKVLDSPIVTSRGELPVNLVYAGNIGSAQSLRCVIDAVATLKDRGLHLKIIGGGVEKAELQQYVSQSEKTNIEFIDFIPASLIFNELAKADALVVHLREAPLFRITIPSKTQSSMAMAKPLVMAVGGEANELVKQADCGVTADPENIESLIGALNKLLDNRRLWSEWGDNAADFYQREFSMQVNFEKLGHVLAKVENKYEY